MTAVLLPTGWAWQEAQRQVARRYPVHAAKIYSMRPKTVGFRNGIFYDEAVRKIVYGSCIVGRSPEIVVGLVHDRDINLDTLVHEYKHSIIFGLPLSSRDLALATGWVDGRAEKSQGQLTPGAGRTRPRASIGGAASRRR